MSQTYRHIPIVGVRLIRVLVLEPSAHIAAPIQCKLNTIPVRADSNLLVHYTALSYTWEGQIPSCEIGCNGGVLLVTPNCDMAIRHLRSTTTTETLWIDSICIDQSPDAVEERNAQVALMGEVYKNAAKVVVWLGPCDVRVARAMKEIVDIAMFDNETGLPRVSTYNRRVVQEQARLYAHHLSESLVSAVDDPIRPLFECSWFYRMWTVQEVTLSALDKTYLRSGSLEIPWVVVLTAVDALKNAEYKWGRWDDATKLQKQLALYVNCRRYPDLKATLDDNPGDLHNDPLVWDVLTSARKKEAGNEKDKIIALSGLFTELDIPFPEPDYDLPVEEIYRKATVASIIYDKSLHILYHAPSNRRRGSLSSWVPDFAEQGFGTDDGRYGVLRAHLAASGPGHPLWAFANNHKHLVLRGRIVDTVLYKMRPLPEYARSQDNVETGDIADKIPDKEDYLRRFENCVDILRSWIEVSKWTKYPTSEGLREALRRTLIMDFAEANAEVIATDAFNEWYDNMGLSEVTLTGKVIMMVDPFSIPFWSTRKMREHARKAREAMPVGAISVMIFGQNKFHNLAIVWSERKCCFVTRNGYFGTAPDPLPVSMQAGDVIALVSGLEMPIVLRPVEEGYRLITHVFVHGMMYGELWPGNKDQLEDIVLV